MVPRLWHPCAQKIETRGVNSARSLSRAGTGPVHLRRWGPLALERTTCCERITRDKDAVYIKTGNLIRYSTRSNENAIQPESFSKLEINIPASKTWPLVCSQFSGSILITSSEPERGFAASCRGFHLLGRYPAAQPLNRKQNFTVYPGPHSPLGGGSLDRLAIVSQVRHLTTLISRAVRPPSSYLDVEIKPQCRSLPR